jgi:hypothetical protein
MTNTPDSEAIDLYAFLEQVYNRGYNAGEGFKQKGLLSDFLYAKKQELLALNQATYNQAFLAGQKKGKSFDDGRELEKVFSDWKFESVVGKDEPVTSVGTQVNDKHVPMTDAEIRNAFRAELRDKWKNTEFKGQLSPRLNDLLNGNKKKPPTSFK